jgi:hypothetical protein
MPAAVLADFWSELLEKSGASIAVLVVTQGVRTMNR